MTFGIGLFPSFVLSPETDRAWRWAVAAFAEPVSAVKFQCKLEEQNAVCTPPCFLICLRAHEVADQHHIWVGHVIGQLIHALGVRIGIRMDPSVGGVSADELKTERPHPPASCHLYRL